MQPTGRQPNIPRERADVNQKLNAGSAFGPGRAPLQAQKPYAFRQLNLRSGSRVNEWLFISPRPLDTSCYLHTAERLMEDIFVVGVGMTRFGKWMDRSVKDLTREAVERALVDAGCVPDDIGAAFFANAGQGAIEGQHMIRGQLALRPLGFSGIPVVNVENACASASTAFHLACQLLRTGDADVVLAVGAEKMYTPDKDRNFAVFNGAWDVHGVDQVMTNLSTLSGAHGDAGSEVNEQPYSVFMDVYAALAKQHMRMYGTTERQLAHVASKNHRHSTLNALSQYQKDMSVDEVLAARRVAWPLTVPMCAPLSDGAAAAVLCRREVLGRFDRSRAVHVCASVLASGSDRGADETNRHICHLAAPAGVRASWCRPS